MYGKSYIVHFILNKQENSPSILKIQSKFSIKRNIITLSVFFILFTSYTLKAQLQIKELEYGSELYNQSAQLLDDKLLKEAEIRIIRSIEQFPNNPSYGNSELLRAKIDLINGNFEVSKNILQTFIEKYPNSPLQPNALMQIAFIYLEQGNFSLAQKYFEKTLERIKFEKQYRTDSLYLDNLATESLYWMGVAIYQQGKYFESLPVFKELITLYPNSKLADDAYFSIGLIFEKNKDYDSAIVNYNKIINNYEYSNSSLAAIIRSSNNYILLRKASRALFDLETADLVISHLYEKDSIGVLYEEQTYLQYPKDEINYLRGEAYNIVGNYSQAANIFRAFLETYSDSKLRTYFLFGAAWSYLNLSNYEDALKFYEKVITEASPEEKNLRYMAELYHAITLTKMGKEDDGVKELSNLSSRSDFPYVGIALLELAQINYQNENFNEAKKNLVRAEREDNSGRISARIHLLLGATYLQLRNYENALYELDKAKTIIQNSSPIFLPEKKIYLSEILFKKAVALIQTHKYAEAIQNLNNYIAEKQSGVKLSEALFWLAESYYRSDLLKNAQKTYQTLLDSFPQFRREEVLYGIGWAYFRDKNFKKSSGFFETLTNEFPKSKFAVEVLARQADGYYIEKNYAKAAQFYEQAAKLEPKSEEGQYSAYQLCHALYHNGQLDKSVDALLNFVGKYPNSQYAPNAVYLIGWIKFNQKQYSEAVNNYSYLIEAYSQSNLVPRAYYSIGDCYYNQGNFNKAIDYYKKVVELFPSDPLAPEALKSTQYCYVALGKSDEAIALADQYISSNPNSPFVEEFSFKKAEMFFSGQKYQDAVTEYDNFLKKHPDSEYNPEALYWMGKSYQNLNEPDKAISTYTKLYNRYPKNEFADRGLIEVAQLLKEKTFLSEADSVYQIVENNAPTSEYAAQAGYRRAEIALLYGDTVKTLNLYRKVADSFPTNGYGLSARYRIGMYYRNTNQIDSAKKEFEILSSISEDPDLAAEAQYRVGELSMRLNNYDDAIKAFNVVKDKYSEVEVWFPLSLLNLGEAYEKKGDLEKAMDVYKSLLAINPDDDYAKTARTRLKTLSKILGK
ncbi:MAG: tetratricopeptide repeat protein [Candidatus Kapaibacteriota bacterium]